MIVYQWWSVVGFIIVFGLFFGKSMDAKPIKRRRKYPGKLLK
jgi:hypothetical protein